MSPHILRLEWDKTCVTACVSYNSPYKYNIISTDPKSKVFSLLGITSDFALSMSVEFMIFYKDSTSPFFLLQKPKFVVYYISYPHLGGDGLMPEIAENLKRVQDRISEAAGRSGRSFDDITLVAVSKTKTAREIEEALKAGVGIIGENRVQEAESKRSAISKESYGENPPVSWHLVGHLQRNKVKKALQIFDLIHSVENIRLAHEIDDKAKAMGVVAPALVQVNTSGEETKFGLEPEEVIDFLGAISRFDNLKIKGLMTMGAFLPNPEDVRPCFVNLRKLKEEVQRAHIPHTDMELLSMGMTADFEIAIEEGSNMVRIGTAIFGSRQLNT